MVKTSVLGTDYEVVLGDLKDLPNNDGMCKTYEKKILVRRPEYMFNCGENEEICKTRFKEVLTHEVIHSFCRESAVFYDDNEELVDWIVIMMPKIYACCNDIMQQIKEA